MCRRPKRRSRSKEVLRQPSRVVPDTILCLKSFFKMLPPKAPQASSHRTIGEAWTGDGGKLSPTKRDELYSRTFSSS